MNTLRKEQIPRLLAEFDTREVEKDIRTLHPNLTIPY